MRTFIALISRSITTPEITGKIYQMYAHDAHTLTIGGVATQAAADDFALAKALRAHDPFAARSASLAATSALLAAHYTHKGANKRGKARQSATWDGFFRSMTSRDSISARPCTDGAYFADFDAYRVLRVWAQSSQSSQSSQ
jgi:hypothetical protein